MWGEISFGGHTEVVIVHGRLTGLPGHGSVVIPPVCWNFPWSLFIVGFAPLNLWAKSAAPVGTDLSFIQQF